MHGGELCSAHAGHVRRPRQPAAVIPVQVAAGEAAEPAAAGGASPGEAGGEARALPTLESEIKLLAERRDSVVKALGAKLEHTEGQPRDALRYLAVLSQVGRSLATMLVQRSAMGGARELEVFFDAVAERVQELRVKDGDHVQTGDLAKAQNA